MSAQRVGPGGIPTISVSEALARQGGQPPARVVDVREMNEFVELRTERAVLMPLSQFDTRFDELPRDQPLLLLCRSGARSSRATAFLLQQGFEDVSNVDGGMIAWKSAGLATRSGPLDPGEGDL